MTFGKIIRSKFAVVLIASFALTSIGLLQAIPYV